MPATAPCPICGAPVEAWERYPNTLCVRCAERARDEQGRPMRFGNETPLGGGFVAEVRTDDGWRRLEHARDAATCFVDGRRCVAHEHRFGGIVVQLVPAAAP